MDTIFARGRGICILALWLPFKEGTAQRIVKRE
jgi:hypothetical protein